MSRDEDPSWEALLALITRSALTDADKTAATWAVEQLRTLLGPAWPVDLFRQSGRLPGELVLAASNGYALQLLLATVVRLQTASGEPAFEQVLSPLRGDLNQSAWLHAQLQLEVARALDGRDGATIVFEPRIPESVSKADIQVSPANKPTWLVEVTSLSRARRDLDHEAYEERFREALWGIESLHGVDCVAHLEAHIDEAETIDWLQAIDQAASQTSADRRPRSVTSRAGRVELRSEAPPARTTTFRGAVHQADGWSRLRKKLREKATQTHGTTPVWLRIDALDGFFQFTDWARLRWPERIDQLAAAIRDALGTDDHVNGVVLSSGLAVFLGGVDPEREDEVVRTQRGTGMRRLVAQHLARETVIIPLQPAGQDQAETWTSAYLTEPQWFAEDVLRALVLGGEEA